MGESSGLNIPSSGTHADEDGQTEMGYQQTLMYGRYSKSLGDYAKEEAKRLKQIDKQRQKQYRKRKRELSGHDYSRGQLYRQSSKCIGYVWKHTFAKIGEDWVFLALLGVIMALVSFAMDYGIETCNRSRLWLYQHLAYNIILQYVAWVSLPVFLVLFSAGFVHLIAPQAIGSGIPEMKTILRGVVLKEYLTAKTLLAKAVGLTATLGSGMPLGKEGPFVHIASIVATLLTKLVTSFQGIYANESRQSEMLAAACAVGVACCFGSPVGGVLFSIEVTSVYFAVRNYWRGFFSAVCGAMIFRLLSIWFEENDTIIAVFLTGFQMEFPYDPQELFVFAMIGVFCGMGGALYVYLHRQYVIWMRKNKRLTKFLQKNRFIYPFLVALVISSLSFPPGLGQFSASDIGTHEQIEALFSNYTWTAGPESMTVSEYAQVKHWTTPHTTVFVTLAVYIIQTFFLSILAATLPVPTGVLIPAFKVGAAFGRLVGEAMHVWFPDGVRTGSSTSFIVPGGYATVGAAAFSGAVTHTISISVIVFEMTGQITHCVPVLIAVLIANAIASLLQPSCYDSIILIKRLPYLPDILPSSSTAYSCYVEDFMVRQVKYIWHGMTFTELKNVLREGRKLRSFPLVDSPDQMILLGSVQRMELISAIERHIGSERRAEVARQRYEEKLMNMEREETAKQQQQRRPSRFGVTPVSDEIQNEAASLGLDPQSPAVKALQNLPKKSILKKSNSYTIHNFSRPGSNGSQDDYNKRRLFSDSVYQTISGPPGGNGAGGGGGGTWRSNLQNMFRRPAGGSTAALHPSSTAGGQHHHPHFFTGSLKRVMMFDMSLEEQKAWEESEMEKEVDFSRIHVDPAPFQLVEKTSLLKVHSLFSMLGVNHAYVTAIGRLIGVVGLKELREAIQDANTGIVKIEKEKPPTSSNNEKSHPHVNITVDSMDSVFSANSTVAPADDSEDDLLDNKATSK